MPPTLLFDLDQIDLDKIEFNLEDIGQVIPQAYEMSQLDAVIWHDAERMMALGYKDVTDKEFWVRGHIPGRPIMPGVIMIEAAAQLSSFYMKKIRKVEGFLGFSGIENARFRGTVEPGTRLYLLGQITKLRSRQFTACVQGVANGQMVFDTIISGMKV